MRQPMILVLGFKSLVGDVRTRPCQKTGPGRAAHGLPDQAPATKMSQVRADQFNCLTGLTGRTGCTGLTGATC
jgi:hypothetical protein